MSYIDSIRIGGLIAAAAAFFFGGVVVGLFGAAHIHGYRMKPYIRSMIFASACMVVAIFCAAVLLWLHL